MRMGEDHDQEAARYQHSNGQGSKKTGEHDRMEADREERMKKAGLQHLIQLRYMYREFEK